MWTKLSNALKHRPHDHEHDHDPSDVMSKVYEQHPNLSHFHDPAPVALPTSSPRNGVFRRSSSKASKDDGDASSSSKLGISLPKKVKSSLALNMNFSSSQASLANRPSSDPTRPSYASSRLSNDTTHASADVPRSSTSLSMRTPQTPPFDTKYTTQNSGSVRSILRDPKTPGTGQNVRFFSRDAYKVITPDASLVTSTDHEDQDLKGKEMGFMEGSKDLPFMERLHRASPDSSNTNLRKRPSVADIFDIMMMDSNSSPVSTKESSPVFTKESTPFTKRETSPVVTSPVFTPIDKPLPQPDLSNFFDISQDHELPTIPIGFDVPLLDSAVELAEDTSADGRDVPSNTNLNRDHDEIFYAQDRSMDRSKSFSAGQTVFHSMDKSLSSSPVESKRESVISTSSEVVPLRSITPVDPPVLLDNLAKRGRNRSRALSDSMFQSMICTPNNKPEADINDESTSALVVYASPEPDPFSAHATTYYTPQTMIPVTPEHQGKERHTRTASAEENVIWNLRTQLALQQELCAQFEIDLGARDELVETLTAKLSASEKADEKRRGALKSWKKKVAELEKSLRGMEAEVDRSREMSVERSVMDEASGEALRMLHRQIGRLEREKDEWEMKAKKMNDELQDLKGTLKGREASERELREGIRDAQDQIEMMGFMEGGDWRATIIMKERESEEERERHRLREFEWEEEKAGLVTKQSEMEQECSELRLQMEMLHGKEKHFDVLKSELEAQWHHTEIASEKIAGLEKERAALKEEVEVLEQKIGSMEVEWNESGNRRNELESEVQEAWEWREREQDKVEEQLSAERHRVSELAQTLQEREDRITELDHGHRYALDSISRLEDNLRQRDAELAEYSQRVAKSEAETEQLREQISTLNRNHVRIVDGQNRELQDITGRESEARQHREVLVKEKAELDVLVSTLKERCGALKEEVERLRRQVHELQQESADKEVKIVQLTKSREQDKEDIKGLDIALDSKQQELELLKRRLGVRGTAGSTPAQPSKVTHHLRDSSVFSTPGVQRPPSAMSDAENVKNGRRSATPSSVSSSVGKGVLAPGKSVRTNSSGAATPLTRSMGPPPPKHGASVAGTPTPTMMKQISGSSLCRSTVNRPDGQPATTPLQRRTSLNLEAKLAPSARRLLLDPNNAVDEESEKENITSEKSVRRRSMLPTPA